MILLDHAIAPDIVPPARELSCYRVSYSGVERSIVVQSSRKFVQRIKSSRSTTDKVDLCIDIVTVAADVEAVGSANQSVLLH